MNCMILAGGMGLRLHPEKGLLNFGEHSLIHLLIEKLSPLFNSLCLIVSRKEPYTRLRVNLIEDIYPQRGPLGAIYTGLKASQKRTFFCGCDMPFINVALVQAMMEVADNYDIVIPRFRGLPEPLHAIYSHSCIGAIEEELERGSPRIVSFFPKMSIHYMEEEVLRIDPDGLSFFNINTPDDFSRGLNYYNTIVTPEKANRERTEGLKRRGCNENNEGKPSFSSLEPMNPDKPRGTMSFFKCSKTGK
jgi:molybdenum cofactor guanylyltransferase